jgi:large repetitive protein
MASLLVRIAALVLGISAFAAADAQTYTYTFFVGNTNTAGCTIATAAGPVEHVKWRLQATVTAGTSPQLGSVTRADCTAGVFGSPTAVASTSAIGLNTGTAGADVIEVQLPVGVVGPTPSPREVLAVVASSDTGSDALIAGAPAAKSLAKGVIIGPQAPAVIPSMGLFGALLLASVLLGVGLLALRRYARLWPLALLLVAGSAWAVAIVIDGQVADWVTVTPSADPAGDVSEAGIDLRALYATTQGPNGYLRVDVTDLQNPPVANPGSAVVLEDGSVSITLTGSDPGNAPLTFQIASPTTSGSLGAITPIDATSASVLYTPNADAFGADSFSFTVDNGAQTSAPANVAITVTPVNDVPSFTANDPPAVNEGSGAHSVPGWASFAAGPANESGQAALEYPVSAIGNPALFVVPPSIAPDGTLSYTLAAQANGSSSFDVAVRDDGGTANGGVDLSAAQTFTLTVNAVNAAPSFVAGADVSALEDAGAQTVAGWATAIDDGDPEQNQALSFSVSANSNPALFAVAPAIDAATGDLSYTAAPDANGTATLSVVLGDDGGTANGGDDTSAPQSFSLTITAVNDAPGFTATNPPAVNEGSGAHSIANWAAFDPGPADEAGQAVAEYQVGAPGNPALFAVAPSVAPNGTLSYTLAPNASGTSSFSVAVRDDGGTANGGVDLSASQVFTITVNSVNSAPSFVGGGNVASNEDAGAQTVAAWATAMTDGDPEVQALTFNVTGNSNPALFSAAPVVNAASGNLSYTAASNTSGSATITLSLSDDGGTANGGSDTSAPYVFTISVNPVNDAPTATAKSHTTHSAIELEIVAASHTGELLEGAADPDDPIGDLTAVVVAGSATPAGAQVTVTDAASGSFRYDPPGGYSGAGSFQFRICDDGVPAAL